MVSALIAAALYGNIGIKVIYNNIFISFFSAPPMTSKRGKLIWIAVVPVYWSIAFIIAGAVCSPFTILPFFHTTIFLRPANAEVLDRSPTFPASHP